MKRLILTLILSPLPVCHASQSPSDSLHSCLFLDPELAQPITGAAGKRLADLDVGEPRTVRLFYFLPNDRPFREEVVQRTRDEMLRIQTWYGRQMKSHGYGYRTFRLETDADGDPGRPSRGWATSGPSLSRRYLALRQRDRRGLRPVEEHHRRRGRHQHQPDRQDRGRIGELELETERRRLGGMAILLEDPGP